MSYLIFLQLCLLLGKAFCFQFIQTRILFEKNVHDKSKKIIWLRNQSSCCVPIKNALDFLKRCSKKPVFNKLKNDLALKQILFPNTTVSQIQQKIQNKSNIIAIKT